MRIYFLLVFLTAILFHAQAQTDESVYIYGDSTNIDVQPEYFIDGDAGFNRFIQLHIIYPEDAKNGGLQGIVYASFIIEKDGSVSTIKILQGKCVSPSCDQEVVRMLSQSLPWKPGLKDGMPIRTKKIVRIRFALMESANIAITHDGKRLKKMNQVNDTILFNSVSTMPKFLGEDGSLNKYLQINSVYPVDAKDKKIKGLVLVAFTIERDGSVSNIHIVPGKGLYPSCDQAAIDIVSKFPTWTPGEHQGKRVRVKQMVNILFE
jgi:TonB family protein